MTRRTPHVVANCADFREISQSDMKIDPINQKILRELQSDGRLSNLELAGRVGLSPSACLRRVQELERSGKVT